MQYITDFDSRFDDDEVLFPGFLAGVNSDILKVKFDRGFSVREVPRREGLALLADFEGVKAESIEFSPDFRALNRNDAFYIVENVFEGWVTTCGEENEGIILDPAYNDAARVSLYLEPAIQCLRFVTCKNIFLPFEYFYVKEGGKNVLRRRISSFGILSFHHNFSLNDSERSAFEKLSKEEVIPFRQPFLGLAFRHFESSFETPSNEQAFISLLIALEIVLQPDAKGYFMSKNAANLLADSVDEKRRIMTDVRELYDARNKIVHQGMYRNPGGRSAPFDIEEYLLPKARNYAQRVIVRAAELGKDKTQLSEFFRSFPDP